MLEVPRCYGRRCRHFLGVRAGSPQEVGERPICEAFPDGIPDEIAYGDDPHTAPRGDQDNDLVYEPLAPGEELFGPKGSSGHTSGVVAKHLRAAGAEDDPLVSRLAARMEPALRRAFLAAVRGAAGAVDLAALAQAISSGQVSAVEATLGLERMGQSLRAGADPLLGRTFVLGLAAGAQAANLRSGLAYGFDLVNPESIAWVRARGAQLVTEVDRSTRRAIQEMVEAGIRDGRAPDVLAREVVEVVGLRSDQVAAVERFRARLVAEGVAPARVEARAARYADAQLRWRGELIARTETQAAANAGQSQLWEAAARAGDLDPGKTRRIWIVAHDDRLDPVVCEPLDGAEAPLGAAFEHPWTGARYQDPPAHPACRCATGLVFK